MIVREQVKKAGQLLTENSNGKKGIYWAIKDLTKEIGIYKHIKGRKTQANVVAALKRWYDSHKPLSEGELFQLRSEKQSMKSVIETTLDSGLKTKCEERLVQIENRLNKHVLNSVPEKDPLQKKIDELREQLKKQDGVHKFKGLFHKKWNKRLKAFMRKIKGVWCWVLDVPGGAELCRVDMGELSMYGLEERSETVPARIAIWEGPKGNNRVYLARKDSSSYPVGSIALNKPQLKDIAIKDGTIEQTKTGRTTTERLTGSKTRARNEINQAIRASNELKLKPKLKEKGNRPLTLKPKGKKELPEWQQKFLNMKEQADKRTSLSQPLTKKETKPMAKKSKAAQLMESLQNKETETDEHAVLKLTEKQRELFDWILENGGDGFTVQQVIDGMGRGNAATTTKSLRSLAKKLEAQDDYHDLIDMGDKTWRLGEEDASEESQEDADEAEETEDDPWEDDAEEATDDTEESSETEDDPWETEEDDDSDPWENTPESEQAKEAERAEAPKSKSKKRPKPPVKANSERLDKAASVVLAIQKEQKELLESMKGLHQRLVTAEETIEKQSKTIEEQSTKIDSLGKNLQRLASIAQTQAQQIEKLQKSPAPAAKPAKPVHFNSPFSPGNAYCNSSVTSKDLELSSDPKKVTCSRCSGKGKPTPVNQLPRKQQSLSARNPAAGTPEAAVKAILARQSTFTLQDLATERGSKAVGPMARTTDKLIEQGVIKAVEYKKTQKGMKPSVFAAADYDGPVADAPQAAPSAPKAALKPRNAQVMPSSKAMVTASVKCIKSHGYVWDQHLSEAANCSIDYAKSWLEAQHSKDNLKAYEHPSDAELTVYAR